MMRLAAAIGCLLLAGSASGEDRLTGVAREGKYYRLDERTVCKPMAVSADGSVRGFPECQWIARHAQAGMGFERPERRKLRDGRRLEARLVESRPEDRSPETKTARLDPLLGKPIRARDKRLALIAIGTDGKDDVLAYWAGHPEVVAVEEVFLSRDGRTAVVVYDYAAEGLARVVQAAVGFRLR